MRARVFVGTRHSPALCHLCVCSSYPPPWLFVCSNPRNSAVGDVARHGNILAFLVAVCGLSTIRLHAAAYLLFPFAPLRLLHKRACGWAVGTSRLRSVAWQHTWTPLVTCVCLVFFFFFFFFFFFLLCCALPRWSFCSSLFVPSYLAARPRRCWPCGVPGMRVRAYLSFPMRVGVSMGVLSVLPLVGFPCRCGFRCAFRGGALWRCLSRYLFCACYGVMHTTYGTYAHNILAFRRPVALLLLVCIFHARHSTYLGTCAASCSFCCDPLRAYFLHEWACIAWLCTCGISPPWCGSLPTYSPCLPLSALCLFRWFFAVRGT